MLTRLSPETITSGQTVARWLLLRTWVARPAARLRRDAQVVAARTPDAENIQGAHASQRDSAGVKMIVTSSLNLQWIRLPADFLNPPEVANTTKEARTAYDGYHIFFDRLDVSWTSWKIRKDISVRSAMRFKPDFSFLRLT